MVRYTAEARVKRRASNPSFLPITKAEIIDYAQKHELAYEIDESNTSQEYTRNRYRAQLLPFLKQENPAVYSHFERFSEETSEDFQFWRHLRVIY